MNIRTIAVAATALLTLGSAAGAQTFAQSHPRRAEVNARLANQNHRINHELREGEISPRRAAALHRTDRAIRSEERQMARLDGGHLTRADQRALNQQENAVSRRIGQ